MRRNSIWACSLGMILICTTIEMSAQTAGDADPAQGEVVLTKVASTQYAPLARQARIQSNVELTVQVKADGSVDSVQVVSGHAMLTPAAVLSAQNSQFECRGCSGGTHSYALEYIFQLSDYKSVCAPPVTNQPAKQAVVSLAAHHITVTADPVCWDDPGVLAVPARTAKCLYLWKCGYK
jgi:TonB family protein